MREVKNRDGSTKWWADVVWSDLSAVQRDDVLHGSACGHPTNRPRSASAAARRSYLLSPDKSEVVGYVAGYLRVGGRP